MNFTDQLNRTISLIALPRRIVSLVPSQTELLVDLGLEDKIVGITKFCVHPKHLSKTKTIVGGTKQVNLEKIESLKPDIILCNKEENTLEIVASCSAFCPVHVSNVYTIEDSNTLIKQYGKLFSVDAKAKNIIDEILVAYRDFKNSINMVSNKKVAYFIWRKPWMVAARNTYIDHMLAINGFVNVFHDLERYPEIELQQLEEKTPDLIFLSSEPFPFKEKHMQELQEVFSTSRLLLVDGEAFSWYGSHVKIALEYLKKLHLEI